MIPHRLLDDAGALGDGATDSSFAAALAAALQAARYRAPRRSSLYFLRTTEAPTPRVDVHRADIVSVCNGVVITDSRRVR